MSYIAWVTNKSGYRIDFDAATLYMDDDIRDEMSRTFAPCTEQEFFTEYERRHTAKFGADWFLSEPNPTW